MWGCGGSKGLSNKGAGNFIQEALFFALFPSLLIWLELEAGDICENKIRHEPLGIASHPTSLTSDILPIASRLCEKEGCFSVSI